MDSRNLPGQAYHEGHQSSHMLQSSPAQVRPPLPTSKYDYLPKRSTPSPIAGGGGASYPSGPIDSNSNSHPAFPTETRPHFGKSASESYPNGTATSSEQRLNSFETNRSPPPTVVIPRKRAHVEDILNPVHEELIVTPKKEETRTPKENKPPTQTPAPKPTIPPSSGSAITISSSTVSTSKSTPTSPLPQKDPVKPPKSIRLHVPLNGSSNVYINFASLAEKTYGSEIFNSKRLLGPQGFASSFLNHDRILDTGSDSEAEDDDASDKNEDGSAGETDGNTTKKKRKRRRQPIQDKYDVDDPFIDDSEALMEQVAAASKDGFFVYSGPLIAEGERAKIDKVEQPKKRKAPAKKAPGDKAPRAKKGKDKEKDGKDGKAKPGEPNVEDVLPVIVQ